MLNSAYPLQVFWYSVPLMPPLVELHFAARLGNEERLAAALDAGAAVDGVLHSQTALHWACRHGHFQCTELLLAAGADPAIACTLSGATALHLAAQGNSSRHARCVAALLAAHAEPRVVDGHRRTPLHWAVVMGAPETARLLAAAGPEAALMADRDGQTPMRVAAGQSAQHRRWLAVLPVPMLLEHLPQLQGPAGGIYELPGLGVALPAALERSEADAAALVWHMSGPNRQHLRAAALCLGAAQRRGLLPQLPSSVMHSVLAQCVAQHAQYEPPIRFGRAAQQLQQNEQAGRNRQAVKVRSYSTLFELTAVIVSAVLVFTLFRRHFQRGR